ncbi:MarR family winged helix-turn-helix transcriptional regulator [Saccharospirillum alexandrii]|uniref:MarR family winged helix-turn-helix transcriptional regulator n=1 Tax=Saccharospirillum alexandrii TaxID=2448477 RepID=UPI000FD88CE9|nr:MarR family transcriptional regulator [Saccharospirillum alexandrii]
MTDVNTMPGHLIRRYHQASVAIFHARVAELGFDLTPVQYAALAKIEAQPGIDQVTLAGLIAYDRTTIGGVVDRLVQKQYLVREVSATDRRARVLKLTELGVTTLHRLAPVVEEAQLQVLSGLDEREQAEFVRLLQKATAGVNQMSRAPLKEAE